LSCLYLFILGWLRNDKHFFKDQGNGSRRSGYGQNVKIQLNNWTIEQLNNWTIEQLNNWTIRTASQSA
jgi:hypothetical protein